MRLARPRILLLVGLTVLAAGPWGCGPAQPGDEEPGAEAPRQPGETAPGAAVTLVFPDRSGGLVPVPVALALPEEPEARIRTLLAALLAGPGSEGELVVPFGEEVALGDVFLGPRGVAYVDLVSESLPDPPASGSQVEMQRVFSLVNTILLNSDRARGVVLLWNGRQRPTLGGHVDTGRPLGIDRSLLREPAR